jgi:putative colanic acid biosynthesis glycosyltransferase
MITVITINYNNCHGLINTINSVMCQTTKDFEYIIIDGGSTDGSLEEIEKVSPRLSFWVSEPDGGIYEGMNKGVEHARGSYCLFLNSGDELAAADVMERVSGEIDGRFDYYVGSMKREDWHKGIVVPPKNITASYLLIRSLPHQSMFIRTELLRRNPFNTDYRIIADWEQQVREIVLGDAAYKRLDITVSVFDVSGVSNTKTEESVAEREKATRALFSQSLIDSLRGRNRLETKLLYSLSKENRFRKGMKIIGTALQMMFGSK